MGDFGGQPSGTLPPGYLVTRLQERLPVSAYQRPCSARAYAECSPPSTLQLELLQ
jgi:hypothetical protein